MMEDKELDKLFKDKLDLYEMPVDEGVWSSIESTLDNGAAAGSGGGVKEIKNKQTKRSLVRRIAYFAATAAAVSGIVYFIIEPNSQKPYIPEVDSIAILDENSSQPNVQPIEKTNPDTKTVFGKPYLVKELPAGNPETDADVSTAEINAILTEKTTQKKAAKSPEYMAELGLSQPEEDWGEEPVKYKKGKQSYAMALSSGFLSGNNISVSSKYLNSMASSSSVYSNNGLKTIEMISEAKYAFPINLGLQAQVCVNSYLSVGIGINYTLLQSKYDGLINKKFYNIKQSLHYVGIPVNVYFTIMNRKSLYLYANVGGTIEKGVRASYKMTSYDGITDNMHAKIEGFQYSANAGVGLEYRFIKQMGLYLEPNLVYFFNSNVPASIRTDQPLQIKAEIGFRFHFR